MTMDGLHCECNRQLRGRHDNTPCPIHGEKGKAAWERLESQLTQARATAEALARALREILGSHPSVVHDLARSALSDYEVRF